MYAIRSYYALEVNFCSSPLSGVYTIGDTSMFSSFSDVSFTLHTCGIDSFVIFNIDSGIYYEHLELNNITGSNITNTITFNGGDASNVKLKNTTENASITLAGTDYITFKNMTIENALIEDAWGLKLYDTTEYITIDSCIFNMEYYIGVSDVAAINIV